MLIEAVLEHGNPIYLTNVFLQAVVRFPMICFSLSIRISLMIHLVMVMAESDNHRKKRLLSFSTQYYKLREAFHKGPWFTVVSLSAVFRELFFEANRSHVMPYHGRLTAKSICKHTINNATILSDKFSSQRWFL